MFVRSHAFRKLSGILCVLLLAVFSGACSKENKSSSSADLKAEKPTLLDDARRMEKEAGDNLLKLKAVDDWIVTATKTAGETDEAREVKNYRPVLVNKIGQTFATVAGREASSGSADRIRKLIEWSDKVTAEEKALPEAERTGLAESIARPTMDLLQALLALDGENEELRKRLGWTSLAFDIEKYLNAEWMDDDGLIEELTALKALIDAAPKSASGVRWLAPNSPLAKSASDMQTRCDALKADFDERMKDPFQAAAWKTGLTTADDTTKTIKNSSFRWTIRAKKPYVICVERDKAWDETKVAMEKAGQLLDLYRDFYREYRTVLGLSDIEQPVPVIIFRKHNAYQQLAAKTAGKNALGHFDHNTGRLYLSDETGVDTLLHEGTHQLIAYNTGNTAANFLRRPYWFEEGIAEYFGAAHREYDPVTKEQHWLVGNRLQIDRINYWRQNEVKAYKVFDLVGLTMVDREKNRAEGNEDQNLFVYSQGWFLIFFLNNFDVDAKGLVKIGAQGKYREGWLKFFKRCLNGDTSREAFLESLDMMTDKKLDKAKFDKFEKEFKDYFAFVCRKLSMKYHVDDARLVPWNEVKSRAGQLVGQAEDDLLNP